MNISQLITRTFRYDIIKPGHNVELLKTCNTLRDYSEYTWRVRQYARQMPIKEAVEKAVNECIQEGILAEFFK